MMKRVHALVVFAALFSLTVLGGCTAEESSSSNGADGGSPTTNGGEVDLAAVNLREAVDAQIAEADYNCCLMHPCSQCMVNMPGCPCAGNLADGKMVCSECKGGWEAGDGAIDGVEAGDVHSMARGGGM